MEMHWFEKWAVNSLSAFYLRWYLLPRLLTLIDGPLAGRGLVLGPGIGWETLALAEKFPEVTLIGVDYDVDQVERARRNLKAGPSLVTRVAFEQGDATALSFSAGSFDFAFELNVFHHIRDYPAAIREVHRVLKPGGRVFLQDLSERFFLPGVRQLFPPESRFTRAELVRELDATGLDVETATGQAIIFLRARRR
ncbi:MAG: class I SAM-dependent methyltransferase [Candidatus Rokubacteria bacterium]|nr:class I SAM-dependent methyltransferase [Candidatus Rokubacteria bacterium]